MGNGGQNYMFWLLKWLWEILSDDPEIQARRLKGKNPRLDSLVGTVSEQSSFALCFEGRHVYIWNLAGLD